MVEFGQNKKKIALTHILLMIDTQEQQNKHKDTTKKVAKLEFPLPFSILRRVRNKLNSNFV